MSKGQIHFSNDLGELIPVLKEHLYPPGSKPFEKRLVIVPHLGLKAYVMQALGRDPDLQVAAGLEWANLAQGWAKLAKKNLPSKLELSLFLQHELISLIDQVPSLARYFPKETRQRRIGPFCNTLSEYFLRYAVFGKKSLPKWQEELWEKWNFFSPVVEKANWKIHLFGFSFLPSFYFSFFKKIDAHMYLFSPCEIFWGDFYSAKERKLLRKDVPTGQLEIFDESFEEQNPLLSSWGKMGRKTHLMVEESQVPTQEYYVSPNGEKVLQNLQRDILSGCFAKHASDETVAFASSPSLYREVEILKEQILQWGIEPKEIQVFASDISPYVPYIRAVFEDYPYAISDIPLQEADPIARAFGKMLALPKKRFALEEVLQVLARLGMDVSQLRKWLKAAHIRWGFSKAQRKAFYLKDFSEEQIHANSAVGTWEQGIQQLLQGLGHSNGLQAIAPAEMAEFNAFYELLYSLVDDLAPLTDGSFWTIPTWLRYFACLLESYFAIDPSNDLYKELNALAASSDHLDREKVPFEGIERVLDQLLNKKSKSHQAPHLQAIRFGSLSEGCIQPSEAICFLGMHEENFPRTEEKASLYFGENDFRPTIGQQDRFLFLQALCSARSFFSISYLREEGISPIVEELLDAIDGTEIIHHPLHAYDFRTSPKPPLISDFFTPISLEISPLAPMEVDLQKLFKFARHPLRYYLHEVLGIYPDFGRADQSEFILDPLTKYQLVRDALQGGAAKGDLPVHLLQPLAKQQIQREVEEWHAAMEAFGITTDELETKKIDLQIGPVRLKGKLELCTPEGLLVRGKNQLEDQMRFWPQALVMQELGLPVLFAKDHTIFNPKGNLEEYLAYFQLAQEHPSPLVPSLAKGLLQEGDFRKALKQVDDEIFAYLFFRDPMPNAMIIQKNWSPLLQKLFGRACAEV